MRRVLAVVVLAVLAAAAWAQETPDAAAWPKVEAALDRLEKTPVAGAPEAALATLRRRLDEARRAPK